MPNTISGFISLQDYLNANQGEAERQQQRQNAAAQADSERALAALGQAKSYAQANQRSGKPGNLQQTQGWGDLERIQAEMRDKAAAGNRGMGIWDSALMGNAESPYRGAYDSLRGRLGVELQNEAAYNAQPWASSGDYAAWRQQQATRGTASQGQMNSMRARMAGNVQPEEKRYRPTSQIRRTSSDKEPQPGESYAHYSDRIQRGG